MNYDGEPRPSGVSFGYLKKESARMKEESARNANKPIFSLEKREQEATQVKKGERETIKTVPSKSWWNNGGRKSKKLSRKNKRKTLRKKRNP
jgi:hypothetical protein